MGWAKLRSIFLLIISHLDNNTTRLNARIKKNRRLSKSISLAPKKTLPTAAAQCLRPLAILTSGGALQDGQRSRPKLCFASTMKYMPCCTFVDVINFFFFSIAVEHTACIAVLLSYDCCCKVNCFILKPDKTMHRPRLKGDKRRAS